MPYFLARDLSAARAGFVRLAATSASPARIAASVAFFCSLTEVFDEVILRVWFAGLLRFELLTQSGGAPRNSTFGSEPFFHIAVLLGDANSRKSSLAIGRILEFAKWNPQ